MSFLFSQRNSLWSSFGERFLFPKEWARIGMKYREGVREHGATIACRGLRQLNCADTDFSLSERITSARTAWDFMKCFWTQIPDRRTLHNSLFVSARDQGHRGRQNQKHCTQLPFFSSKSEPSIKQTSLSFPLPRPPAPTEAWFSSQINKRSSLSFYYSSHSLLLGINDAPVQHCHGAWNVFGCLFTWKSDGEEIGNGDEGGQHTCGCHL